MAMPRFTWNHALGAGHRGPNVALAALIEDTIEHNFFTCVSFRDRGSMRVMAIFQQLGIWTPRLIFFIVADAKTTTLIYRLCQRSRTADKAGIAVVGRRDAVRARRQ